MMLALWSAGCAAGTDEGPGDTPEAPEPMPTPEVLGLGTASIAIGEELRFEGTGFVNDERGYTTVTFRGRFTAEDGTVDNVDLSIVPQVLNETEAAWSQFGPYRVPFVPAGNRIGTFEGRVFATNVSILGEPDVVQASGLDASLVVEPSIVVRELQPDGAGCAIVSVAALNLLPYRMQVEAVGFDPTTFRYVVSPGAVTDLETGAGSPTETVLEHVATGRVDALAEPEWIRFAEVPYGLPAYRGSISILAEDSQGVEHQVQVRLTVRRPLQVSFRDAIQPAEIYAPVPVSGCIPGGVNGRMTNYSESREEVRERTFQVGWEDSWETSYTVGRTESYTEGDAERNRVGFSTTDGTNWSWNVGGEVYGEGGVSLVAEGKAGFKVTGGVGGGGERSQTNDRDREWEQSRSWGEAVEESASVREAEGASGSEAWAVSSSDSQALEFSAFLLPNRFGVFYRQTTRLVRTGQVVAYDLCGQAIPVGDMALDDYTWAPELAMDTECPPFPESSFPEAQCLAPPCEDSY